MFIIPLFFFFLLHGGKGVLKTLLENGTYREILRGGKVTIEGMDGEKPLFMDIVRITLTQ